MKRHSQYRLQPLLQIKERARKRAEIALARALGRLVQEQKKLKKLEEEKKKILERKKQVRREMHEKMASGDAQVKDSRVRGNYLRRLEEDEKKKEEEIEAQKKVIVDCEMQVKRARRDYIDAVKELRIMEKHKELWKKKLALEISREEEKEMDELGNVIHQLRQAG